MSLADGKHPATEGARTIPVWDPLVRLIHWSVAATVLLNGTVTDPESELHHWLGYVAVGLIAVRLLWGLLAPGPARLGAFRPDPRAALGHIKAVLAGDRSVHVGHNPLGALMIWNIWSVIAVLAATGIMMGNVRFFGVEWVEELHEAAFNWLIVSVALHVCGVILDTRRTGVPLLRAMIDGKKRIPAGRDIE